MQSVGLQLCVRGQGALSRVKMAEGSPPLRPVRKTQCSFTWCRRKRCGCSEVRCGARHGEVGKADAAPALDVQGLGSGN